MAYQITRWRIKLTWLGGDGGVGAGGVGGVGAGGGGCGAPPSMKQLVQRLCRTWSAAVPPALPKSFDSTMTPSQPDSAISVVLAPAPSNSKRFYVIQA